MPSSIPASQLVNVVPSVLSAGGNPLSLNAVMLTTDPSVPIGAVAGFPSLEDVQNWFGPSSTEATLAAIYFAGYDGALTLPSMLYFAQFNTASVAAYLRGGSTAGMSLAQLQALTGTLALTINGSPYTTGSINLSSATSFSNAAALMQTALNTALSGTTCTYDSVRMGFVITSPTTGASSAITVAGVGALSTGVKLTAAAGAVVSPGAVAATPAGAMAAITALTQNFATFMTTFEPDTATKLLFATWVQGTNDRFAYVAWDSDASIAAGVVPSSFGAQVAAASMDGIFPVWGPNGKNAAFVCGTVASIDFDQTQGRITFAYKGQSGLTADVTSATAAANLQANGYNFYGAWATANDRFVNLQPGSTPGGWRWFDTYVNQIWLNSAFQLAFMSLLTSVRSVPYNVAGYNMLRAAGLDPITAALNAGVIQPGVTLSASQRAQINSATGTSGAAAAVETLGYFLDIKDASPLTRANRGSPPMTFYYTDGGAVQKIELASIAVE